MVLVKHPDGAESRLDVSAKTVTIGRWDKCDIQIDDDSIRPVHVRVVALADGEFRVHGVAAPSLRPFATNDERPDEFMVAQSGDQVTLPGGKGEYTIHFLSTETAQNLDSAAADETTESPPRMQPSHRRSNRLRRTRARPQSRRSPRKSSTEAQSSRCPCESKARPYLSHGCRAYTDGEFVQLPVRFLGSCCSPVSLLVA